MHDDYSQFEQRKQDHIELAMMESNQAQEENVLDSIFFEHEALPQFDFSAIKIGTTRFTKPVASPFFVSSMTAGHKGAVNINRNLIEACAKTGWAMGVGSQRRELTDFEAKKEWQDLRRDFPAVTLFSNLGIAQLIKTPLAKIEALIESINAEAIIIHCNPLQELIQPEGTPHFKDSLKALEDLVKTIDVPVIVKETGCGFSWSTLKNLNEIGVAAVDVSGLGGTHWGRIEGHRAKEDKLRQKAAMTFRNWGINTVQAIQNAVLIKPDFEIWGSGGVRNGLDAARLIALGAESIGYAKPMLAAALTSAEDVFDEMMSIEYELKVAMFCTGSPVLSALKGKACLAN